MECVIISSEGKVILTGGSCKDNINGRINIWDAKT